MFNICNGTIQLSCPLHDLEEHTRNLELSALSSIIYTLCLYYWISIARTMGALCENQYKKAQTKTPALINSRLGQATSSIYTFPQLEPAQDWMKERFLKVPLLLYIDNCLSTSLIELNVKTNLQVAVLTPQFPQSTEQCKKPKHRAAPN